MLTPDEFVGRTVGGRFRITRFLGEGGMATVYVAEQESEPKEVALKIMNRDLMTDRSFVKRFQREAKAASSVRHPNSVQILEYGVEGGLSYLAMELLDGEDLFSLLAREGPIGQKRAVRILIEVAEALSAAHELGIVHRDLKPENIMVMKDASSKSGERVKVLDFGIAKLIAPDETAKKDPRVDENSAVTNVGTFIGTPAYMSPEQCALLPIDTRADIYTCGVLLFQLVTGKVPFWGETPLHTATKHIHEQAPKPSSIAPAIARPLEALILKALQKKPQERYQTAKELGAALREVLPLTSELPAVRTAGLKKPAIPNAPVAPPAPSKKTSDEATTPRVLVTPKVAPPAPAAPKANGVAAASGEEPIESARTIVGTGEGAKPAAVVVREDRGSKSEIAIHAAASAKPAEHEREEPTSPHAATKAKEATGRRDSISDVITHTAAPQSDPEDRAATLVREPMKAPSPPSAAEPMKAARRTGGEGLRRGPQGTEVIELSKESIAALTKPPSGEPETPKVVPRQGGAQPTLHSAKGQVALSEEKARAIDQLLSEEVSVQIDIDLEGVDETPARPLADGPSSLPDIVLRASDPMNAAPQQQQQQSPQRAPGREEPRVVLGAQQAPPPPPSNPERPVIPPPRESPSNGVAKTHPQLPSPPTLELKNQRPPVLEPFPLAQPKRAISPQRGLILGFAAGIVVALIVAIAYFFLLDPQ